MQKKADLAPAPANIERRKYVRFSKVDMRIHVKRNSIVHELIKGERVDWLNFSRYGLAFACQRKFNVNEKILIDIKTSAHRITNLVAVIHNARRQNNLFRYGVQFYFGANSYMSSAEIQDVLDAIEQSLDGS
jgi:hypothetical protein